MATILPLDNTVFATPGEGRFYAFLRDAVKPDSHCLAWYSPSLEGLEPDFILYIPEEGLIVFEVKDWAISQIREADNHSFKLALAEGGREESRKNPWRQARDYTFALMNRIKSSCKRLLSTEPHYQGKPRLPVHCGLVFTNITRDEFAAAKLNTILPQDKILFSDDLAIMAAQMDGPAFSRLRKQLSVMFPPPFSFSLTSDDIAALRELLWPKVRIVLPKRSGEPPEDTPARLRLLDAHQESLARRLDAPRAVIEGPAGSGKTIVLAAKAVEAHGRLRRNGCELPVLVVCFNLTLVHYLKRLLAGHNARLGRKDIQVAHFFEFCRSLLDEPLAYEKEDGEYYELVTRLALEKAANTPGYGAIFIDEGQDFSDDMLAVLRKCLSPDGMLWISLDTKQSLYEVHRTWPAEAKFQRFVLRNPYRATRRLAAFCESLPAPETPYTHIGDSSTQPFGVQNPEGEAPRLRQIADAAEGIAYIAGRIRSLHGQGVPYSEMMILYAKRRFAGLEVDLPLFLQDSLEECGIIASWPARDAQSKAGWDITTDSVTISTIHSMKGMDAEAVFIIGLDALKPNQAQISQTYVASSRARRFLDILYVELTPFIASLQKLARRQA